MKSNPVRLIFTLSLVICVIIPISYAYANQPSFTFNHISLAQRLPGANVYCVFQDRKGMMWFAIESVGLCKYDGENFTVYEKSDSDTLTISNNFPLSIVEDTTGNLWIGTTEGLNRFDRENGIFYRYNSSGLNKNSIPNNYISDLHIDKLNNLWIATYEGVSKYCPARNEFTNILVGEKTYTDGLPARISNIYEDDAGNIWIGSYSSGLFLIDQHTNENHTINSENKLEISRYWLPLDKQEPEINQNYAVQQICQLDEKNLLIGKINGLYRFNQENELFTRVPILVNPTLNNSTISVIEKDINGRIWVGFASNGLLYIDPKQEEQYYFDANIYISGGIRSNSIRDIFQDNSGLIWIATKFQGLHTYDKRQEIFKNHRYNAILNKEINDKFVLCLMEDSKHNIWIGTKNNGLYRFNPSENEIINFSSKQGKTDFYISVDRIECLVEDAFGDIWAGTEQGVHRLLKTNNTFVPYNSYFIRCMVADKSGNIWIGTNESGIIYYDRKLNKTSRYNSQDNRLFFSDNSFGTRDIYLTSDSILWISTFQKGLYKYSIFDDKLTHYLNNPEDSTSISGNMVRGIFQDNTGNIWIGTKSNGLNKYNSITGTFIRIKQSNGLPPNSIYNILQDRNNNYWMGSHEGLVYVEQNTGNAVLFNMIYGLENDVFELNASCETSEGLMIFGGSGGLNVFDPETVRKPKYKAPLIITSFKVYDRTIKDDISNYDEISVSYKEKFISIGFVLTEYSDPLSTRYKFKLINFDKDWIDCGTGNYATYTSLPPGEYYFQVIASNSYNDWSDSLITIKIIIEAPFWRKPFFIVSGIILLIISIVIVYLVRLRFLYKNEERLKKLVEIKTYDLMELNQELEEHKSQLIEAIERAEESDKLKTAFLANMSHEIRTPMNGIIGFTDLLKEPELTGENQRKYIEIIQRSSNRMLRIINDLIDISKIESGQIGIVQKNFTINSVLDELYAFFKPEADLKKIIFSCHKELSNDESIIVGDRLRITQVLSNLIDNALKFTIKGQIKFGYILKNAEIEFYVQDSGCGISPDMHELIFERFRQVDNLRDKYTEGSGLGLSISKAIVEMHQGKMWVNSVPQKGSIFYFTLPYIRKTEDRQYTIEAQEFNELSLVGKKVLVAEDDEISMLFLTEILEDKGICAIQAVDGVQVLEILNRNNDIDIILMDMKMPHKDGLETLMEIKKKHKQIPVILQTAFAIAGDKHKYLSLGFDDYITKPVRKEMILEMISKHISKRKAN